MVRAWGVVDPSPQQLGRAAPKPVKVVGLSKVTMTGRQIQIPAAMYWKLDKLARSKGRTIAELIEAAIKEEIKSNFNIVKKSRK